MGPTLSIFEEMSPFKIFSNNFWNQTWYKKFYKNAIPVDKSKKFYTCNQTILLQSCPKFGLHTILVFNFLQFHFKVPQLLGHPILCGFETWNSFSFLFWIWPPSTDFWVRKFLISSPSVTSQYWLAESKNRKMCAVCFKSNYTDYVALLLVTLANWNMEYVCEKYMPYQSWSFDNRCKLHATENDSVVLGQPLYSLFNVCRKLGRKQVLWTR